MASRPKLRKTIKMIEDRGGERWFLEQVAEGRSLNSISSELDCSRWLLYDWMKRPQGDETGKERHERMKRAMAEARKMSAEAHAETAGEILDALVEKDLLTSADVKLASERAGYRRWLAEVRDRETFGKSPDTQVTVVNAGGLHLDALRNRGRVEAGEGEVIEAEVIEDEEPEALEPGEPDDVIGELL